MMLKELIAIIITIVVSLALLLIIPWWFIGHANAKILKYQGIEMSWVEAAWVTAPSALVTVKNPTPTPTP